MLNVILHTPKDHRKSRKVVIELDISNFRILRRYIDKVLDGNEPSDPNEEEEFFLNALSSELDEVLND